MWYNISSGLEGHRKDLLTSLGTGLTVDGDRVMGGTSSAEFGRKRIFGKLTAGDKKGEEVEGEGKKGRRYRHGC